MKNYLFIHKSLTILSPPILESEGNEEFKFMPANNLLRDYSYADLYPIY